MRAFREPGRQRPDGQSFVAFAFGLPSFPFRWHYHPEVELTLIESGVGTRFVGDNISPFAAGDLVLLGGNLPHTWSSESQGGGPTSHRAVVVHFPEELFGSEAPEFRDVRALLRRAKRGCVFSAATAEAAARDLRQLPERHGLEAWCLLASVLNQLASDRKLTLLASAGYVPEMRHGAQRRLERALAYIEENAGSEELGLRNIARTVHLTPAAFSRFFREMTGGTVVAHILQMRIGRACRELSETDRSVAEIAYACGFGNLANFNRRFRALKRMTPTDYRRHFRESTP